METFQYSGRNQLTEQTGLGTDINYWYSATANDGRLAQKHNWVTGEEENYTYDSLGRLATAYTTGPQWGLSFVYDGFGNRLQQNVTKGPAPSTVQTVDTATNRLNGAGFGYDSNGNMTGWSTPSGSVTASYDIENRMTQSVTPGVTETYKYVPGNLRVRKSQGSSWVYTVYGQGGEALGTFTGCSVGGVSFLCDAKLRVYFGGRLVLNGWTGVKPDRLGSPDGTHGRVYPYGEVSGSVSVDQDETFTTYKRDVGTGLDYAQNRYYASAWGRFTTADPYRASGGPEEPGSWNRYSYVGSDTVNFTDRQGTNRAALDTNLENVCMFSATTWDELACRESSGLGGDGGGGGAGGCSIGMDFLSTGVSDFDCGSPEPYKPEAPAWECPSNFQAWIDAHGADALATGLSEANVLTAAAIESGWGNGDFAKNGNSFFNLETVWKPGTRMPGPKYAYQSSTHPWMQASEMITKGRFKGYYALVASYNSAADSFKSFAATDGKYLIGVTDPKQFASILVAHGINAGSASYFGSFEKTFQDCLNSH
ncbi:RHS repeat-associated core domain-containing protein [Paludibaculum fermentans]|uniref:Glucosaminidase domain-containing protein n=1 Tax=Paludibaculum fermentans TaxID=1473598 RepID=A0A7S7NX84_PALFE|nr:RHS repeat-associated core domain-containing protein [Paludibaculum fermentans]QOY91468.1 glucosaminidase domain-containing protein [Paludibaculum fermentans]